MITRELQQAEIIKLNQDMSVVVSKVENYFQDEVFLIRAADKQKFTNEQIEDIKAYLNCDDTNEVVALLKDIWGLNA